MRLIAKYIDPEFEHNNPLKVNKKDNYNINKLENFSRFPLWTLEHDHSYKRN